MHANLSALTRSAFWAIRPEAALAAILQLTSGEVGLAEYPSPSFGGKSPNKVATIPIQGVLTNDGPAWYGSNYQGIAAAAEKAAADPDVKHIILAVDSPGGEVHGLPETAAVLAAAAKVKPMSAIVEGASASAAYWLSSQANRIVLTPSGEVGSVGVRMMHVDVSKSMQDAGIKVTELHAGDYKTEWSPYKPLSTDAQVDMQRRLAAVHGDFIDAVANGRGNRATATIRKARFGEGRMFSAPEALSHGLVDRVQSSHDFYRTVHQPINPQVAAMRARFDAVRRLVS